MEIMIIVCFRVQKECGYYAVQGNVDSLDWKNYGTRSILETVLDNKRTGEWFNYTVPQRRKVYRAGIRAADSGAAEKGFGLVPVSSLIYKENYYIDQEGRQGLSNPKKNKRHPEQRPMPEKRAERATQTADAFVRPESYEKEKDKNFISFYSYYYIVKI